MNQGDLLAEERRERPLGRARALHTSGRAGVTAPKVARKGRNGPGAKGAQEGGWARADSSVDSLDRVPSGCAGWGLASTSTGPRALVLRRAHGDDSDSRGDLVAGLARYAPLPRSDRSSLLLQVQPPTGEPDAGDPPSGSEGGGVANPTLPTPIQSASQQFFGSLLGGASHRL